MTNIRTLRHLGIALYTAFSLLAWPALAAEPPARTAGRFLADSLLRPKSLMRTSSFLGIEQTKKNLQVAIVLDGTDSMGKEISDLTSRLADIVKGLSMRKTGDESTISVALVVYRDQKASSGPAVATLGTFTSDLDAVRNALREVKTETGDPFFEEQVDLGISRALKDLPWAERTADVSRWVLICGDAPPYPEDAGSERRTCTTDELVTLATEKDIQVYAILCNSGFANAEGARNAELATTAQQARGAARLFFDRLSSASGGKYLDMWDTAKVEALLDPSKKIVQHMPAIRDAEIAEFRRARTGSSTPVRIAVLPHQPLTAMSFEPREPGVQFATYARLKLEQLPGLVVSDLPAVEDAWKQSTNDKEQLKAVAKRLDADYLIWGSCKQDAQFVTITTSLYARLEPEPLASAESIVRVPGKDGPYELPQDALDKLRRRTVTSLKQKGLDSGLMGPFSAQDKDEKVAQRINAPIAESKATHDAIVSGIAHLEASLKFVKSPNATGETEANPAEKHLRDALLELDTALQQEPKNALAHLLISNCYYNLARYDDTTDEVKAFMQHLMLAYQHRRDSQAVSDLIGLEIEAEYALLVKKDIAEAIEKYQKLADTYGTHATKGAFAQRAHWMLAGIYLGDWGVRDHAADRISLVAAREHIIHMLADWPDSEASTFYRNCQQGGPESQAEIPLAENRLPNGY